LIGSHSPSSGRFFGPSYVIGVVDGGDESLELHGGREVVDGGVGRVRLLEQDALRVAVDLHAAVLVARQTPGHRVEGHQRLPQRTPHPLPVEEAPVRRVHQAPALRVLATEEVDARRVEPRHHQVRARVPQPPGAPSPPTRTAEFHCTHVLTHLYYRPDIKCMFGSAVVAW
jgi:hypothetical protein